MSALSDPAGGEFETIGIVGVGLIGGSIAAAVKHRRLARTVVGAGRSRARLEEARQRGLIDEATTDLSLAARLSDLLIFCTPVDRIVAGVLEAAPHCRPGTQITDAGSVKGIICRALAGTLPRSVEFVGSHPLAGSARQGFEYADARLFEGRTCIVTPCENNQEALARLGSFWRRLGSNVIEMSPEAHDEALAQTSHLPHVAAAGLAGILSPGHRDLAASGFRDTTRIAAGDPQLWAAILLGNAANVLSELGRYGEWLARFRGALEARDAMELDSLLRAARDSRQALDVEGVHGTHVVGN